MDTAVCLGFFSQKPNGYSAVKDTMKKNLPPILLLAITYQIFAISNFDSYSETYYAAS